MSDDLKRMMELMASLKPMPKLSITVGSKDLAGRFMSMGGVWTQQTVAQANQPVSFNTGAWKGTPIEVDASLPYHAMVVETLEDVQVYDMRNGKGVKAKKSELPIPMDTPDNRLLSIHTMLMVANKGPVK